MDKPADTKTTKNTRIVLSELAQLAFDRDTYLEFECLSYAPGQETWIAHFVPYPHVEEEIDRGLIGLDVVDYVDYLENGCNGTTVEDFEKEQDFEKVHQEFTYQALPPMSEEDIDGINKVLAELEAEYGGAADEYCTNNNLLDSWFVPLEDINDLALELTLEEEELEEFEIDQPKAWLEELTLKDLKIQAERNTATEEEYKEFKVAMEEDFKTCESIINHAAFDKAKVDPESM